MSDFQNIGSQDDGKSMGPTVQNIGGVDYSFEVDEDQSKVKDAEHYVVRCVITSPDGKKGWLKHCEPEPELHDDQDLSAFYDLHDTESPDQKHWFELTGYCEEFCNKWAEQQPTY